MSSQPAQSFKFDLNNIINEKQPDLLQDSLLPDLLFLERNYRNSELPDIHRSVRLRKEGFDPHHFDGRRLRRYPLTVRVPVLGLVNLITTFGFILLLTLAVVTYWH